MKNLGLDLEGKNEKNAYAAAVAIALILASALLVVFYVVEKPEPDPYTTIYLLDDQGALAGLPEVLVANVNSTFSVRVNVVNHLGRQLDGEVRLKIASNSNADFPLAFPANQTFTVSAQDGTGWEETATVTLNDLGSYTVAFELWRLNEKTSDLEYSKYVALNIQVIAAS